jgi:signal transduction histidine kinase
MNNEPGEERGFFGLALVCNSLGTVRRVLRNDLEEEIQLNPGDPLTSVIDHNSMQKFFTFLYRLREEKALYDWSINVHGSRSVRELFFVGGVNGEEMIVVASTAQKVAGSYFEEAMRMNNEQANLLREAYKQQADRQPSAADTAEGEGSGGSTTESSDDDLFSDFSRLNNELTNLQRNLQKKNRILEETIRERDKYLGMAAHDLRNPLGGIAGICSLLIEGEFGELNEEQKEYLAAVRDSTEHMQQIVNEILDLSRHQTGTLTLNWVEADLIDLVDWGITVNRPRGRKKRIEIVKETDLPSLRMKMDSNKVSQVVDNLLSNAVKYSHSDSTVTIRVYKSGGSVAVEVADQGQGIPQEEMGKLFEPFSRISVQTTAGEESTGLGLAICRRIIEGHGGTIEAESEEGRGSVFRFYLPLLS